MFHAVRIPVGNASVSCVALPLAAQEKDQCERCGYELEGSRTRVAPAGVQRGRVKRDRARYPGTHLRQRQRRLKGAIRSRENYESVHRHGRIVLPVPAAVAGERGDIRMILVHRWLATAALAAGLGMGAMTPTPAHAQEGYEMARVVVDVADVIFRSGQPYYRYGNGYGYDDRLVVVRDRYGRPVYYRQVPRYGRSGPPYGNAYGYHRNRGYSDRYSNTYSQRRVTCDRNGRCVTRYYDPRYDRRNGNQYYDNRYYDNRYYDSRNGYSRGERYWDGYRWRTR
jgi:hypothetical protein